MSQLKNILQEIHRRSVWQVLGVYLAVSWVVLQVVETLTESAGLPDWVPPGALVLLLIGLPIVLATAVVQEGVGGSRDVARGHGHEANASTRAADPGESMEADLGSTVAQNLAAGTGSLDRPSTRPSATRRLFTWRNAILGGVLAFALLAVAIGGYWVMWASGIGPVGSLVAQGVLEERDPVILSDFENLTPDPALSEVVTEALRVDLDRSEVLSVLSPAAVGQVLRRMNRADEEVLGAELAREVALREGVKAVIEGEVGAAGSGYVLTARLTGAQGDVLASFRVAARDGDEMIDAIDELSQDIRERSGESLRAIKGGEPLSAVTTGSVEALRLYSQAIKRSTWGDRAGAVRLLEDAIELDPEFAMAYRKLGVELGNLGMDPERALQAVTRAYELRSRLTDRERGLAEAYYFTNAQSDPARAAEAYERVLSRYPDDPTALNNLALLYPRQGRFDEAVALLERAVSGPAATAPAYSNLFAGLWDSRREAEAEALLAEARARYPNSDMVADMGGRLALARHRWDEAHELSAGRARRFGAQPPSHLEALYHMASADAARGKLEEARRHSEQALRIAREEDQTSWVWAAAGHQAWYELFVARSTSRASALLEGALDTAPYTGGFTGSWDLLNLLSFWSLAGEVERAAELGELFQDSPEQDRFASEAGLYFDWAQGLARDDAQTALDAIRLSMERELQCQERRCWGHFESGLALEALGRTDEAIQAYEMHLGGTDLGDADWDGANYAASLEQLCHLSADVEDAARVQEHCGALVRLWAEADAELEPRIQSARERMAGSLPADVGP
jgi:tetratricopeptide (TPR) repeat protein